MLGGAVATGRLGLLRGGSDKLCLSFALVLGPPLPISSLPGTFLTFKEPSFVQEEERQVAIS